jgi:hypothetical protein
MGWTSVRLRKSFVCDDIFPKKWQIPGQNQQSARSSMKNRRPTNCVKCDTELQAPSARGGRPSRFCSEGCKVSAEAEMRRLNVVLRRLEDARANEPLRGWGYSDPTKVQAAVAKFDEAIAPLQKRFDYLAGVPNAD